jgi:heterodisulfide reductase subunit A-like polyferredoxin/coenzyme F420-reducing hydrogenase delta subunit
MYDINRILDRGIEFKGNIRVGEDITLDDLRKDYKAVFVAIGAQDPAKLPVDGADSAGVLYGLPFLRTAKKEQRPEGLGEKVVVIGGGNVSIDCARSALRLGAKEVDIICLETRDLGHWDRMPAHEWEIEEAEEEGIKIHGSLGPKTIIPESGKVVGLETTPCLGVYDEDKRFAPKFADEAGPKFDCDSVIIAIGQRFDHSGFDDIEVNPNGTFKHDEVTLETNLPGVFVGGDVRRGPYSVVCAVKDGFEGAESIDRILNGKDMKEGREVEVNVIDYLRDEEVETKLRKKMPMALVEERVKDFREVELGYDEETAISEADRCLSCSICCECLQCVAACEADAVDHDMVERYEEIDVGSIILAPGYDKFDARLKSEYGYGVFKNVLTSLEFERVLSASGPYEGHVVRPSDEKQPTKIAWINCVGSRDTTCDSNYCSSVCCTYAIKEAVIAKEHVNTIEPTIFYMDMRTFGKGFDSYFERARDEYGVRFIRCRVPSVYEDPESGNLFIKYEGEDGSLKEEEFEMVVLAVGFQPPEGVRELADKLGINLNEYNFCKTSELQPVNTSRDGVFVCGSFSGPKDIPETVMEASGAAAQASSIISSERDSLVVAKEYPEELDVEGAEARVGVFVCNCGINIGGYLDVPGLVEYAQSLPNVVYAEDNLYTCSSDTQKKIVEKIKEHELNRVIVASCTPRTHEPLFQQTIREAGLNPHLFEMANIRDQCSWVHMTLPSVATDKARDLIRIALAKSRMLEALPSISLDVIQKALVVGGGLAGMVAAIGIADQGFEVALVEKEGDMGGNLRHIYYTLENDNIQNFLKATVDRVNAHPKIKVHTDSAVEAIDGYVGNFNTKIKTAGGVEEFEHGVVVVATGGSESKPDEYLLGQDDRVITQLDLEKKIHDGEDFAGKNIVNIQCVGSRNETRPYCSRVCCVDAVKNALKIKEKNPDANVFVLYRDMRTYGFNEAYYEKAREEGVIFIRYEKDKPPVVQKTGNDIELIVKDLILREELVINPDLLVLSTAIDPREDNKELAKHLKIPLTSEGFFLEAHAKLRPVDFATEGVFLAGMAHSPKSIGETIAQAYGAASRACTLISHDTIHKEPTISFVVDKNCDGCAYCIDPCPYNAITLIEYKREDAIKKTVEVNEALCKGCGVCMATCPKQGVYTRGFTYEQIKSQAETALEVTGLGPEETASEPRIVAFCCNWCSYTGADLAGVSRFQYAPNVRIIRVMCTGMIHPNFVIETLTQGADGVLICGCHPGDCHYLEGNLRAEARSEAIELMLEDFGLEPERFRLEWVSASEAQRFAKVVTEMVEQIKTVGPSPYK